MNQDRGTGAGAGLARQKLPVWQTIRLTYGSVFGSIGDIVRMCWPWIMMCAPLAGYVAYISTTQALMGEPDPRWPRGLQSPIADVTTPKLILSLLVNFGVITIAVAWQRRIVLREPPVFFGSNVIDASFWSYIFVGLRLGLILVLPIGLVLVLTTFVMTSLTGAAKPADLPTPFWEIWISMASISYFCSLLSG